MTSTLPKSRRAKRAATLETWYRIYDKALIVTNHVSTTRRTGRSASIVERLSNPEALGHARLTYHFDGAKLKEGRASIAAKKIADLMDGPSSIYDSSFAYYIVVQIAIYASILSMVARSDISQTDRKLWYVVDAVTTAFFLIEFILQWVFFPFPCQFFQNFLVISNLLAIMSFPFDYAVPSPYSPDIILCILSISKVLRVVRILKTYPPNSPIHMVVRVVSSSIQPFAMVTFMIVIVVVFYASAVYFTDSTTSDQVYIATSSKSRILGFESIPTGLYWAVSTVCTVGYGDVVPYTMPGKLIGGLAAGSGILVLAIPISIVGQKFLEENSRYQASQAAAKSASIVKMVGEAVNQLGTKLERKYGITDGFPGNNQSPQTEPTNFTTFHSQANDEYRELEAIVYRSFSRRESSVKAALADEGQTVFGQFQHILRNLMEGTPI